MPKQVLIDADPFAYRAVYSSEGKTIGGIVEKIDEIFKQTFAAVQEKFGNNFFYKSYLTGSGNFRYEISDTYKKQRPKEKPPLLSFARNYILESYDTEMAEGQEADDAIAIAATNHYPDAVIVSIDKDFRQVPCLLYNPMRNEWTNITEEDGLRFFYKQLLMGDRVDNIAGVWKIGNAKSDQILEGSTTELEMWKRCLEAYEGDYERAVMNGRLLWLRRKENQLWTPPEG